MANFGHLYDFDGFFDNVEYAVVALAGTVFFAPRKFFGPRWTWIFAELANPVHYLLCVVSGNSDQVFADDAGQNLDTILRHYSEVLLARPRTTGEFRGGLGACGWR